MTLIKGPLFGPKADTLDKQVECPLMTHNGRDSR
jgi:hypothetical protein